MHDDERDRTGDRWARFRFAIVGPLLAAPPRRGELRVELERLAERSWRHPLTGEPVRFSMSTLERWYYAARSARRDPVARLRRRVRSDAGRQRRLSPKLRWALEAQYKAHPRWSYQLHTDNLAVLVVEARRTTREVGLSGAQPASNARASGRAIREKERRNTGLAFKTYPPARAAPR